jgi:uncharacterized protein (TIGR04222 family)
MDAADWFGSGFALLYGCLLAVATALALALRAGLQGSDEAPGTFAPTLHPIEIAYLVGGTVSAVESAVVSVRHRALAAGNQPAHRLDALREVLTYDVLPVERAIYTVAATHGGAVQQARRAADSVLSPVRSRLTWLKLLAPDPSVRRVRGLQLLLFGALLALGAARFAAVEFGGAPSRASDFHVFWLWIAAVWLVTHVRPRSPCRTRYGDRVLEQLRTKNIALLWKLRQQPQRLPANDFALAVALFGDRAVGEAYAAIGQVGTRRTPSNVPDDYSPDGGSNEWLFG